MDAATDTRTQRGEMMTLSDGTEARVRPVTPDDGPALLEPVLSSKEVQHLTCVDGVDRVAIVVEVNGELIAVGRYHRLSDQTQAEVAFVGADAYQHHHIATELLHRLAHIARQLGVSQLKAEVLVETATVPSVFREAGLPLSSTC